MAQFDLYVDVVSGDLVTGPSNGQLAAFPKLVQGDTPAFNIYLLKRTVTYPLTNPYSIINNAALSLKVGIGPKDGTAGSALYTQQFTWTRDANNQYFTASLPLNTAAIATLIGSGSNATAWFEIEYTEGGFPTTVFQKLVTIEAEVIETGVLTTPAGATAVSLEEIIAQFLKQRNKGFILDSDDGSKSAYVYLGNDGALHCDPLT